jgi:hypothetical protein
VGDFPCLCRSAACKHCDPRGKFVTNQNGNVSCVLDYVLIGDNLVVNLPAQQREQTSGADSNRGKSQVLSRAEHAPLDVPLDIGLEARPPSHSLRVRQGRGLRVVWSEFIMAEPEDVVVSLVLLCPFLVITVEVFLVDRPRAKLECGRSRDHHHESGRIVCANVKGRLRCGRGSEQDRHC